MKHKSSLVLMEQLAMVLVFALAAALCLSVFAAAHRLSQETEDREQAAFLAQNAAELLKNGSDPEILDTGDFRLEITVLPSPVPGFLKQTQITVFRENSLIFSLETGWQEGTP